MTSTEIRNTFLEFFKSKQHKIVPSAPIVVKNDPTLLFTNAGMNQFKDYFIGNAQPQNLRIADTQKCLRVSGKHNDLEEVGVDTYHHTMFEMLGNWSFGDYFKKEAIAWSWELLTEVYKLDKDRLYVTIFEGDTKENLPKDEESFNEWKKLIAEDRILLGNKKDNFWEMGDTGPCGPCTEIHVDCRTNEERQSVAGKTLVNKDHPQVIEIWNNVFIQFNRSKDSSLQLLPAKHVDTGMGFERLVRVLQNKTSNYDTDIFTGTIVAVENITKKKYDHSDTKQAIAFRVLADHIRAIAFTIADGQLPSNTGAGYVIRRILRRAVRYYYSHLNYKKPLLYQLLPVIATQFENVLPELQQQLNFISKVVKEEEEAFLRTLDKGLKKMDDILVASQKNKILQIDGVAAFELFDTYGFPIDLTRLIATENNLTVDEVGFEKEMQEQKMRSRVATAIDVEDWVVIKNRPTTFVGYNMLDNKTHIVKYRKATMKSRVGYQIVLAETPFYAESGGQVGDTGELCNGKQTIAVIDTKKENNLTIHFATEIFTDVQAAIVAKVAVEKRKEIAQHHSATHLLHAALRSVLGNHVAQKGSLVNEQQLRFDFSHFAKMNEEEIHQVEKIVNEKIRANIPVAIKEMKKEEAIALGAMALFGEKYGDIVRVVVMDEKYSVELCGGTHVATTGELGFFKIKHESAVAAGVRRIEAVSGTAAEAYMQQQLQVLNNIAVALKNPKDLNQTVSDLLKENTLLKKDIEGMVAKQIVRVKEKLLQQSIKTNNNFYIICTTVEVPNADNLKKLCFELKSDLKKNYAIFLASNISGKPFVALMFSDEYVAAHNVDAMQIIKIQIAPIIKGGGGGQQTFATAGGQDASNLQQAVEKMREIFVAH